MELKGKTALVTGGTKGIGAAVAIALARAGANIILNSRSRDAEAEALIGTIQDLGRKCDLITADCGRPEENRRLANEAIQQFGSLDVLVHSAGGPMPGPFLAYTPEQWMAAFDVHVHAAFHLCQVLIPHFQSRRGGCIILIGSAAGMRGMKTHAAYAVVKGALPHLARCLAHEFAGDDIRVNCVAPGVIRTRFHDAMTPEQKKLNLEQRIPLGREGTSEQVADLILTLVRNDYITGETVAIDGGLTMRIP